MVIFAGRVLINEPYLSRNCFAGQRHRRIVIQLSRKSVFLFSPLALNTSASTTRVAIIIGGRSFKPSKSLSRSEMSIS